jgi:hypothetical protein
MDTSEQEDKWIHLSNLDQHAMIKFWPSVEEEKRVSIK